MSDLVGPHDPQSMQEAIAQLKLDPLCQSMYRNGEETLWQGASATGGMRGTNTQRGFADFGAATLSQVYGNRNSKLGGIAGLGVGATGSGAGFGAHNADVVTGLYGQQGTARADNFTKCVIDARNWQNFGNSIQEPSGGALNSLPSSVGGIF